MGTHYCTLAEEAVEQVISRVGSHIILGIPLGLGKPNQFVNALYKRVKQDAALKLTIYTALTLERPIPAKGMEARFAAPLYDRIFADYDDFQYALDRRKNCLPANVEVYEFFYKSGAFVGNDYAQQHYISTNYTHAPRDLISYGVNVLAQMVARRESDGETQYSLSCNPEVSLDMMDIIERQGQGRPLVVGQVHEQLPFMLNDAQVDESQFDLMISNPAYNTTLFAPPNMPISTTDYLIGLHVSSLIADGGTLQIGIGSLGDAIVYASEFRHLFNDHYRQLMDELQVREKYGETIDALGGMETFEEGLYGNSEMFVDGFFYLMKAGILKRKVYQHEAIQCLLNKKKISEQVSLAMLDALVEAQVISSQLQDEDLELLQRFGIFKEQVMIKDGMLRVSESMHCEADMSNASSRKLLEQCALGEHLRGGKVMHGGFFLGPESFYQGLRDLSEQELLSINMTNISYVNQLYGSEGLKRAQRQHARFVNTVFTVSLLGAATSDALENGQVVSGVGGQYNFVAQAHELDGARSILMLKATRSKGGELSSNIIWNYAHTTIPRHLRDIFVTEYGIADLRGKCDADVIKAMLNIADSRFQVQLMSQAKAVGKLAADYQIPSMYCNNFPQAFESVFSRYQHGEEFPRFPFGTDFTDDELELGRSLKSLKAKMTSRKGKFALLWKAFTNGSPESEHEALLHRMGFDSVKSLEEKIERAILVSALKEG